jgi:ubiquitin-protein ligase
MSTESKAYDIELTPKATKTLKKFGKRIAKESKANSESSEFKFVALNNQYWYFEFEVNAGLYAGQKHIVEVKLVYGAPPDLYVYPRCAPKCTFMTSVWHPNISETGTICLDVLKDNWSPTMFSATILDALKLLLEEPDASSPQNKKAADMLLDKNDKNGKKYNKYVASFYNYEKAPEQIRGMISRD